MELRSRSSSLAPQHIHAVDSFHSIPTLVWTWNTVKGPMLVDRVFQKPTHPLLKEGLICGASPSSVEVVVTVHGVFGVKAMIC